MADLQGFLSAQEIDYTLLGKNISEKREARKLGLREAAEECGGISYSTLSRLERGTARPDLETLKRVIAWLDISPSSLFMGAQPIRAHLRAQKNLISTVAAALADAVKAVRATLADTDQPAETPPPSTALRAYRRLSHTHREELAVKFRETIKVGVDTALDPFRLDVRGARVEFIDKIAAIPPKALDTLTGSHAKFWSAATIPLNESESEWIIVLNSAHTTERKRATVMEEICHILLGHNLSTLSHIEGQTFRDYNKDQEADAFGLGAAILVPRPALLTHVRHGESAEAIAKHFGVSKELIEYRIKMTGAWYDYKVLQHVTTK